MRKTKAQLVDEIEELRQRLRKMEKSGARTQAGALRESENRFKDFAVAASDWFWEMDEKLRFSYFSERFTEITGVQPEQLLGKTRVESGIPNVDTEVWQRHLDDLAAHRPFRNFVHPRTHPDGRLVYLSINGIPIYDEDGNFKGYRGSGADVTERLRESEAFKRQKTLMDSVFRAVPDAMMLADTKRNIIMCNPATTKIFGYELHELIGKNTRLIYADEQAYLAQGRERYNVDATPIFEPFVATYVRKNGERFPGETVGTVIRSPEGRAVAFIGMIRDITNRKKAEVELHAAMEMAELASNAKSEFLANMSHELRTPLNAIIGFSDIMRQQMFGPLGDKRYHGYAADILESGNHLLSLISDILDFSKIEARKLDLEERNVEFAAVVDSSIRIVKDRAEDARVRLKKSMARDLPDLWADERAVKQIVLNLLSNAIKFTKPGGQVTVRAKTERQGDLLLSVADTGIGIAEDDIPLALSPFGQIAKSTLTRTHEGTGLGLPLVKMLAELHSGEMNLASEPGVGTTVTVRFPADRARHSRAAARR